MTKVLDCTIRDGGYLNNWNFSDGEFSAYAGASKKAGFDYFEIGYRSNVEGGRFRRCKSEEIRHVVQKISGLTPVVMLNCAEFEENLFLSGAEDFVSVVRVACHSYEIEKALHISKFLMARGYQVFLHIMNVKDLSAADFKTLKGWDGKSGLISLYIADSYGSFLNSDVEYFYKKFSDCGFKKISFHAHNNLQMALSNSLKVIELGAYSIDVTTGGTGRGGGNLPAEILYAVLNKSKPADILEIYSKLLGGDDLKKIICGAANIHPSKIDEFLDKISREVPAVR